MEYKTDDFFKSIHKIERKFNVYPITKKCYYNLTEPLLKWLDNEDFNEVISSTDVDEGEIIRNFRMAVQILREIRDSTSEGKLLNKITNVIRKINRDIVDAENQLRILT